jgi:hypothetical protein
MTDHAALSGKFELKPGFAFLYESDDHLFFMASSIQESQVLILNLTTVRTFSDTSCVIQPGEHPFVSVPSCVAYNFAEFEAKATILSRVDDGSIIPHHPLSPQLMERIWDGADVTRHLPLKCRELLKRQGLI